MVYGPLDNFIQHQMVERGKPLCAIFYYLLFIMYFSYLFFYYVFFGKFGLDWLICVTKPDRSYSIQRIRDILPSQFDASALQLDRQITDDVARK